MTFDEWFVRNNDGDDSGKDIAEYAWKAGAASRDAEVVSLTNQRDYEYVRAENAEQERDQLREQVKMLRDGRQAELEDAERYRFLRGYMASERTDLDDEFVSACSTNEPERLDEFIDSAIRARRDTK